MTELDRLPPDQRAVLSLLLDRGKSYAEVADMLAIPERAVRDRAHSALDALADDAAIASGPRPPAPVRAERLARVAGPSSAAESARATEPARAAESAIVTGRGTTAAADAPARHPRRPRDARPPRTPPSSRTTGALLLGGIVIVIVVAVILISGGSGKSSGSSASTASSTQSTTTASAGKPSLKNTIALTPLEPTLKASGTAYVLSENGRSAFYITAQGLPPSSGFFYAVWLYNSPSSTTPLGRASNVGSDGRMQGGNPLPTNANLYHQLIVTRETSTHPSHPGPIVLRGTFSLH